MVQHVKKHIACGLIALVVSTLALSIPLNQHGVQRAEALTVEVIADGSLAGTLGPIEQAIDTAFEAVQTALADWDSFRDTVLDPLFWMLANAIINDILMETAAWIRGEEAFVKDLGDYIEEGLDEIAGELIYGSDLGFLCSPFELDIKIALWAQYQAAGEGVQCTLTDVMDNIDNFVTGTFSEGGWAGWFELTQGCQDEACQFLNARAVMRLRLQGEEQNRREEVLSGEGWLTIRWCESVDSATGEGTDCEITTPGSVINRQVNHTLGLPTDRLVNATGWQQIIDAVMLRLFEGITGGLRFLAGGGSSGGPNRSFGSTGDRTYVEALRESQASAPLFADSPNNPIQQAIDTQTGYIRVLTQVVDRIDAVENQLEEVKEEYPDCSVTLRMNSELTNIRADAQDDIRTAGNAVSLFLQYQDRYSSAPSPEEEIQIMVEFGELNLAVMPDAVTNTRRTELDLTYTLPSKLNNMQSQIQSEEMRCAEEERRREAEERERERSNRSPDTTPGGDN